MIIKLHRVFLVRQDLLVLLNRGPFFFFKLVLSAGWAGWLQDCFTLGWCRQLMLLFLMLRFHQLVVFPLLLIFYVVGLTDDCGWLLQTCASLHICHFLHLFYHLIIRSLVTFALFIVVPFLLLPSFLPLH